MKIYELAKEVNPYVVEMRRYFHEHPELSNQEDKTIERIGQELAGMGIEYEVVPHGGIVAILEGKTPGKGKTVLLRADCDALPVQETKENLAGPRVCCSKVDGVMHACGHDGHTAMLLGAAKILKEHLDEVHGRIILFFERAEENGGGIPQMLAYMDEKGKFDLASANPIVYSHGEYYGLGKKLGTFGYSIKKKRKKKQPRKKG